MFYISVSRITEEGEITREAYLHPRWGGRGWIESKERAIEIADEIWDHDKAGNVVMIEVFEEGKARPPYILD